MGRSLDFDTDGRNWPLREHSQFVIADGYRWHVQRLGQGPRVFALHGTGASTHSWAPLAERLRERYELLLVDLPGHGFSGAQPSARMSIGGMARGVEALLATCEFAPTFALGHSAGAVVLAQMTLDRRIAPRALVAVNGALLPLPNFPHHVFSPVAGFLSRRSMPARAMAWRARHGRFLQSLVDATGSRLAARELECYRTLASNAGHVQAALSMMAEWDLPSFERGLSELAVPTLLLAGTRDGTVPPTSARDAARRMPHAEHVPLERLGHLAHEEAPDAVLAAMGPFLALHGPPD